MISNTHPNIDMFYKLISEQCNYPKVYEQKIWPRSVTLTKNAILANTGQDLSYAKVSRLMKEEGLYGRT